MTTWDILHAAGRAAQQIPPAPAGGPDALYAWVTGLAVTGFAAIGWRYVRRLEKLVDELVPTVTKQTETLAKVSDWMQRQEAADRAREERADRRARP